MGDHLKNIQEKEYWVLIYLNGEIVGVKDTVSARKTYKDQFKDYVYGVRFANTKVVRMFKMYTEHLDSESVNKEDLPAEFKTKLLLLGIEI